MFPRNWKIFPSYWELEWFRGSTAIGTIRGLAEGVSDELFVAASGAVARQHELDVLSNNLANVSTDGFRELRVSFESVLADPYNTETNSQVYVAPVHTATSQNMGPKFGSQQPGEMDAEFCCFREAVDTSFSCQSLSQIFFGFLTHLFDILRISLDFLRLGNM